MEADLDPFDTVLSLEDQYYAEGHALGVKDGSRAGRIEGRVFGLEKGFEKFVAMGTLHAKAAVWAARLPASQDQRALPSVKAKEDESEEVPGNDVEKGKSAEKGVHAATSLPLLSDNPRLAKHVTTLHALAEPASLSTQNNEDTVSDFDDRFKRAQAKVKIVEKLVGEGQDVSELKIDEKEATASGSASAEARGGAKGPKRIGGGVKMVRKEGKGEERNMEDFGALGGRRP